MKGPSLRTTAFVSAALHATALLVTALAVRQPIRIITSSPYVVDLVSHAAGGREGTPEAADTRETAPGSGAAAMQEDLDRVNERLSELRAKKRIEKIVQMRNMITVGRTAAPQGKGSPGSKNLKAGGGSLADVYYSKIIQEIRREWAFPDLGNQGLEAVIAVKVARDGTLTVSHLEKSSGNALFDRSALRALTKASPVTPPPYEMELGIRFFP